MSQDTKATLIHSGIAAGLFTACFGLFIII